MIYLDNSATTQPFDRVAEAMCRAMKDSFYNPSSLYAPAMDVEMAVQAARGRIAQTLGSRNLRVIYTSGGTESNNTALTGVLPRDGKKVHLITTAMEHASILSCMERLEEMGHRVTYLPVDAAGRVDVQTLSDAVCEDTALVSIMQVNNETGAVQDLAALSAAIRAKNPRTLFHVDGVQGYMRLPVHMPRMGIDMYSLSGHKIHASKGIGALVMADRVKLRPLLVGGGQQNDIRPGTENVPGILGLDAAVSVFETEGNAYAFHMRACKAALLDALSGLLDGWHVNGPAPEDAAPHILNLSLDGVRGEVVLHTLEESGIYVATGSACSAKKHTASHALLAHGLTKEQALSSIRISLSPMTAAEDMAPAAEALAQAVKRLRRFRRK